MEKRWWKAYGYIYQALIQVGPLTAIIALNAATALRLRRVWGRRRALRERCAEAATVTGATATGQENSAPLQKGAVWSTPESSVFKREDGDVAVKKRKGALRLKHTKSDNTLAVPGKVKYFHKKNIWRNPYSSLTCRARRSPSAPGWPASRRT